MVRDEREAVRIVDKVNGIEGSYIGKNPVDPQTLAKMGITDVKEAYRIEYYADVEARSGIFSWFVNLLPDFISDYKLKKETDTIYPKRAVEGPTSWDGGTEDSPNMVIILHEDVKGDTDYADFVEMTHEQSLKRAQSREEKAESDSGLKELEAMGGEQPTEEGGYGPRDRQKGGNRG